MMKKINSLILLIETLSKAEKKSIYLHSNLTQGKKVYMELFRLIETDKITDSDLLVEKFSQHAPKASFNATVQYLYNFILDVLIGIKSKKDKEFQLYQQLLGTKILAERNLESDYYSEILDMKSKAKKLSNFNILLILKRMALDYQRLNNFKEYPENQLYKDQNEINKILKILRQINEQSSLLELLHYRMVNTPFQEYEIQRQYLNDLVVSEITLVSNLSEDVFEIQKLHQLFQARYFIFSNDYKSALNSFFELNKLFEDNRNLWTNPPWYYVSVIEGILQSLLGIGEFEQMNYFIEKIENLEDSSLSFHLDVKAIIFIYKSLPLIRNKENHICKDIVSQYQDTLISKIDLLTPYRQVQLSLILSIINVNNKEFNKASRLLHPIINGGIYRNIWYFRPLQMMYLVVHYELGNVDIVTSQIRSIRRLNKINKECLQLEETLFKFINKDLIGMSNIQLEKFKNNVLEEFDSIENSPSEQVFPSFFDFKNWMLQKIERVVKRHHRLRT